MEPNGKHLSKFLSLVLRHHPERIGIRLDSAGWTGVDALLEGLAGAGFLVTRDALDALVAHNPKKRFAYNDDGTLIRASQGHSVPVDLAYDPVPPPGLLFHGTAEHFLPSILREGLRAGARHGVHLSADAATARSVGARHGKPVVLRVDAGRMAAAGMLFFCSANGVWLTAGVPPDFLELL
ncbi:MAG: RNA 2'-phosphotransferase [Chitinophagaceae bacterium]|nr:MAG: RNA 2'-phosphotransferase [Chitinophagaceae bacterium]